MFKKKKKNRRKEKKKREAFQSMMTGKEKWETLKIANE